MPSRSVDVDAEDPTALHPATLTPPTPGPVLGGLLALAATLGDQPPATYHGQPGVSSRCGGSP